MVMIMMMNMTGRETVILMIMMVVMVNMRGKEMMKILVKSDADDEDSRERDFEEEQWTEMEVN